MLYDILRETRAYQEMKKEGLEEGIQKGREEGGLEALHKTLLALVQARFSNPIITRLAKGQALLINNPDVLQNLIIKAGLAQTPEEAQKHLLEWESSNQEQH